MTSPEKPDRAARRLKTNTREGSADSQMVPGISNKEWHFKGIASIALMELALVAIIAIFALDLWKIDFSVPFNYWGDTLWFLAPIKGMIENGWTYQIPQLSAPFGLSAAAFPSMTNFDWLMMKAISLFSSEPGIVLNTFWLFSILLTAWSATLALSLLGIKRWFALGAGVVYSFLPFAFMRNVSHINLVYYCVPLLTLLAIYFARGCNHPRSKTVRAVGYTAVLAQGFNYIYFSFFSVLLFAFAGLYGFIRNKSWKPVKGATFAIIVLVLASSINLTPTFISWHEYGELPNMSYKTPQEAEIYGLKIRKMLAPQYRNIIPIFSEWGRSDKSIKFPNENENTTARLGPMAAVGFVLLLMVSMGLLRQLPSHERDLMGALASLSIFCLLFTTVGGFGAIFNQILPDFRCYNRFSVFIAFLALAGLSLWWQSRMGGAATQRGKLMLAIGLVALIAFSLYDQLLDAGPLNNRRPADEIAAGQEREVVKQLEAKVPAGTSIFQLPVTGFPTDEGKERMLTYDHARPYLWSSRIRWSWPPSSPQSVNWVNLLDNLEGKELMEALVLSDFSLIWVDRFGYPDNGDQVISTMIQNGADEILPGISPRYSVLDLNKVKSRLQQSLSVEEFAQRRANLLEGPYLICGEGFYRLEKNQEGRKFRWSQAESRAEVYNFNDRPQSVILSFYVTSGKEGRLTASSGGQSITVHSMIQPTLVELPLNLEPNSRQEVRFVGEMGKIDLPPGETRDLHFALMDMKLRTDVAK